MELIFKVDTRLRKQFFVPESFAHPAKMNFYLLLWIVEKYTTAGETILDPMAGMGTTLLACTLGRNVVLVELEEKFCKMCQDNWEIVRTKPQLGFPVGNCQIIQGDARQLEGLLVDQIVTSPPYAEAQSGGGIAQEGYSKPYQKEKIRGDNLDPVGKRSYMPENAGDNPDNIQRLPYGQIGKIITSPPYAETGVGDWQTGRAEFQAWVLGELATKGYIEWQGKRYTESEWRAMNHGRIDGRTTKGVHKHPTDGYGKEEGQVGNLPYGQIEKIITSPPYEAGASGPSRSPFWDRLANDPTSARYGRKKHPSVGQGYDTVDSIITSPPHSDVMGRQSHEGPSAHGKGIKPSTDAHYGDRPDNIGNLKSQSYLEAMLQVYQQCHKVLKPQGLMILVVKNFIRNKQVVRLDTDTIKLCEQAGFAFVERHYRKLTSQSFWRVIYHKKYPEVEQIKHEDILVFQR